MEGMKNMSKLMHEEGESKTAMPPPKIDDSGFKIPMENDVDMTGSLRDVTDLYPCMIVMCGSAGCCMTVSSGYMTYQR